MEIIGKPLSYLNSVDKINFANQQDTKVKVTKIHIFIFVLQAKRELKINKHEGPNKAMKVGKNPKKD